MRKISTIGHWMAISTLTVGICVLSLINHSERKNYKKHLSTEQTTINVLRDINKVNTINSIKTINLLNHKLDSCKSNSKTIIKYTDNWETITGQTSDLIVNNQGIIGREIPDVDNKHSYIVMNILNKEWKQNYMLKIMVMKRIR